MKVIKEVNRIVGDKTYKKYKINLPKKLVEEAGFVDKELEIKLVKGKLVIQKV